MSDLTTYAFILFYIYLAVTIIVILLDNRDPSITLSWILIFTLVPVLGFLIYLVFGRNWRKKHSVYNKLDQQFIAKHLVGILKPLSDEQDDKMEEIKDKLSIYHRELIRMLQKNSHSLLTICNDVQIFHDGKTKFDVLKEDLQKAKKFIHLQYYIWRSDDRLGREIIEILDRKVKEGVEVRILYDYAGCFMTLKSKHLREYRKAGICMQPFFHL
jgi:cardiolipin synthase